MEITITFAATLTVFFLLEILLLIINKVYNRMILMKNEAIEKEIKDSNIYEIALLKGKTQEIFKIALSNLLQNDEIQNDEAVNIESLNPTEKAVVQFEKDTSILCFKNLKHLLTQTHLDTISKIFYDHEIYKPVKVKTMARLNKLKLFNPLYNFWKIKIWIYLLPIAIAILYFMNTKQDLSFFLGLIMLIIFMAIIFHLSLSNTNKLTRNGVKYSELFEIFKGSYPDADKELIELIKQYNIEYHCREIQ